MKKKEEKGATAVYLKPRWLESYKDIEVPKIPPGKKVKKEVIPRRVDYGL
jgi:hypothetical protein